MELLRDEKRLDATRTVQAKTKELIELETDYQHLSAAYQDIETKAPQGLPRPDGSLEEMKIEAHLLPDAQMNKSSLSLGTSQSKEKKLLLYISEDVYGKDYTAKLKDIFIRYGSSQNCTVAAFMELAQFHRFLQDAGLTPKIIVRAQADVLFYKGIKGKNISFWRWVEILAQLAKRHYKSERGLESLSRLLTEIVLVSPSIRASVLPLSDWTTQIQTPEFQSTLTAERHIFETAFKLFKSKDTVSAGNLTLGNYLVFTTECHIVPELVSKLMSVRLFRAAQRDPFSDFATYQEFELSCCFLSRWTYKNASPSESLGQLIHWLSFSAHGLKVVSMEGGKGLRLD